MDPRERKGARYESSITAPRIEYFEWQEAEHENDLILFRDIVAHGCTILMIYPDDEDACPPFDSIYSVGFYLNLQHPELLVKGLDGESAGGLINEIFRYVENGHSLKEGDTVGYDFGLGECKLVAKNFPRDRYEEYLGWACWFYRSLRWKADPLVEHKFPVLQLFWPDSKGLYPWDEGCHPAVKKIQTI